MDKIIEVGKSYGDKRGFGYIDESSTPSSSRTTYVVKACLSLIYLMMCHYVFRFVWKPPRKTNSTWIVVAQDTWREIDPNLSLSLKRMKAW